MSSFKKNLEDAMEEEQGDVPAQDDSVKKAKKKKSKKSKSSKKIEFSFKSFITGLGFCFFLSGCLAVWTLFNADTTIQKLQSTLPSKTTIVETSSSPYPDETTITMTGEPIEVDPLVAKKPVDVDPSTESMMEKEEEEEEVVELAPDEKPHRKNAVPFSKKTDKPLLSFVIYDLGLSQIKTANIIENFSPEISLAFSPYAKNLETQTMTAQEDGHEIWLTLPLETKEYPLNDPGPSSLLINASTKKNKARLAKVLNATNNQVGYISQPDHVFKPEDASVNPALRDIFVKGYAIIDSNISMRSFVGGVADRGDYPYAQNMLWLDDTITPISFNQKIRRISEMGKSKKDIIVMLRPYPASLKAVQKFLNSQAADQFEMAPVSAQLINK